MILLPNIRYIDMWATRPHPSPCHMYACTSTTADCITINVNTVSPGHTKLQEPNVVLILIVTMFVLLIWKAWINECLMNYEYDMFYLCSSPGHWWYGRCCASCYWWYEWPLHSAWLLHFSLSTTLSLLISLVLWTDWACQWLLSSGPSLPQSFSPFSPPLSFPPL